MLIERIKPDTCRKIRYYGTHSIIRSTRLSSGKKGRKLLSSLIKNQSCIVNRIHGTHKEKIGGYRFLNNKKITEHILMESLQKQCEKNSEGAHLICLQDTTEYNFQHHIDRLEEGTLGIVGNNRDVGFFCHLMLCFDAENCLPMGIPYTRLWSRDPGKKDKNQRGYKNLPIEEKESYRWIEAAEKTKESLSLSNHITFISDRESDIYQLWARVPDSKTDLIIRARKDRKLYNKAMTALKMLDGQQVSGEYIINLKADKRNDRSKRKAKLQVKYSQIEIKKPHSVKGDANKDQEFVRLFVVEAKEDKSTTPEGELPIHWLLFTTHTIENYDQARQIIRWYSFRWQIEQFFRITKRQGLDFESSQLETGDGLKKLSLLSFAAALKILQLTLARDGIYNATTSKFFTKQEIIILNILNTELEGETKKQQNPFKKNTLAWASWVIARLGSWSGYKSQAPPGPITFKRGYDEFRLIIKGFNLARNVYKE